MDCTRGICIYSTQNPLNSQVWNQHKKMLLPIFFLLISTDSGFNSAFPIRNQLSQLFQTKSNDLSLNTKSVLLWCHFKGWNRTSALISLLCFGSGMFLLSDSCQLSLACLGWLTKCWGKHKSLVSNGIDGNPEQWWCLGSKAFKSP